MSRIAVADGFPAYFRAREAEIGAFVSIDPSFPDSAGSPSVHGADPSLAGLPFAVKDNIAVKGFRLTCASRMLEGFECPYTATAVRRLEAAGARVVGKTNLDEFGMGSSTDGSALKRTNNPWDASRTAGGSSGGSAAAVAAGLVPFALGSDTGGSVRQPASFCGVVGLKPTWGAVSRYGLVAYASSLEAIGVLADGAGRARAAFRALRGADPADATSRDAPADAPSLEGGAPGPRTIGVLSPEAAAAALAASGEMPAGFDPAVLAAFRLCRERLAARGHRLVDVDLPSLKYASAAYYAIACAEASANLARFDGVRYGLRPSGADDPGRMTELARAAGFGPEVKARILAGTFVLRSGFQDRYYLRAQRIRAGIARDFARALSACDALLMPVFPVPAFGRGEGALSDAAQKAADVFCCAANLAGLPALAFPVTAESGLPCGAQLAGRAFSEGLLLDLVEDLESAWPAERPAGFRAFWG